MTKRRICSVAVGLGLTLAFGLCVEIGTMPAQPTGQDGKGKEKLGHGKRVQEFLAAFNRGDAKAVAGFWTPEGEYVDAVGNHYKGRTALEKLYRKVFTANKGAKLTITVISVRMVGTDVALEDGITEVTPAEGGPPSVARFLAVAVKRDGEWYFESVQDSIARPPSNAEHFEDLEWLIGDWIAEESKGEGSRASYSWAENKNFIVSTFATTLGGLPVLGGTQWICWDAVDKQIRSYSFYSGGGIGEAVWTKKDGSWYITVAAKSAAGQKASLTHVVTQVDADHATWQPTQFTVDGKRLPDAPPMKMKRVK
jgi:uncharacterized protein (TIGR02246 family)